MRLQCFPPTRYVKNGEYPWCALFRKVFKIGVYVVCLLCIALLYILGCLLALYGSTVHPRCILWFSGQFFSA